MRSRPHILTIFGTRPEAIKLAPVILEIQRTREFRQTVCNTAQHRELVDGVLAAFGIEPDVDLDLMTTNQDLDALTARVLGRTKELVNGLRPDLVLVQGDTTSAMAASLATFHSGIPLGHIEAGLRTGHLSDPWPEEANRRIISQLATHHFAPTETARANLVREGIDPSSVTVTGNTSIDALHLVEAVDCDFGNDTVLVTCHRRENYRDEFRSVVSVLRALAAGYSSHRFVCPLHPNPKVREPLRRGLCGLPNFELREPFDYAQMLGAIRAASVIVTDSGGVQEEAAWYGTPTLVLREHTDRPESVELGLAHVVGHDAERASETFRAVRDHEPLDGTDVYGRGDAASQIYRRLLDLLR